jgi:hypothetical protein
MNFKTDFFPSLGLLTDYLVNDSFRNTRRSAINKEANRDPPLQFREMAVSVVMVIERLGRPKILRRWEMTCRLPPLALAPVVVLACLALPDTSRAQTLKLRSTSV